MLFLAMILYDQKLLTFWGKSCKPPNKNVSMDCFCLCPEVEYTPSKNIQQFLADDLVDFCRCPQSDNDFVFGR